MGWRSREAPSRAARTDSSSSTEASMSTAVRTVGVVGCGLMGAGIAQVAAQAGYRVIVREVDRPTLEKGWGRSEGPLGRAVEKGTLTAGERDRALANLTGTTSPADLAACGLVVEAIVE